MKKILFTFLIAPILVFAVLFGFSAPYAYALGTVQVTSGPGSPVFQGTGYDGISDIYITITIQSSGNTRNSGSISVTNGSFTYNDYTATTGTTYTYLVQNNADSSILNSGTYTAGEAQTVVGTANTGQGTAAGLGSADPGSGGTGSADPDFGTSAIHFKITNPVHGFSNFQDLIKAILDLVMIVATPIIALMIIYAGFLLTTAKGDTKKVEAGRQTLLYAVIGGLIILGAKIISTAIEGTINSLL